MECLEMQMPIQNTYNKSSTKSTTTSCLKHPKTVWQQGVKHGKPSNRGVACCQLRQSLLCKAMHGGSCWSRPFTVPLGPRKALAYIQKETGAEIVLSSTWRLWEGKTGRDAVDKASNCWEMLAKLWQHLVSSFWHLVGFEALWHSQVCGADPWFEGQCRPCWRYQQ